MNTKWFRVSFIAVVVAVSACSSGSSRSGGPTDLAKYRTMLNTASSDFLQSFCSDWAIMDERAAYAVFMDSANSGTKSFELSFADFKQVTDLYC